ncbi:ubiquitin-conjugating enzyme E2 D4-like [Rhipicephalus sanguineus]|uniref:ubiquitin-conjugating enzyme E2 D4-like n=1 Tax=Rhipicephalus sanguineus TaxID=34632 RepID=UPI0020C4CB26|nr:ubiquitin-conjugating enzyme E2 D4-like [Rhipicephalus sanguineus]
MGEPSKKEPVSLPTPRASEAKNIASGTAEPRVGKTASVTQSASNEACGPTKSTASVATGGGTATATTGHPVTAKPSKTETVLPGTSQSPQNAASSASPKTQSAAQRRLNEELADLVRDPPPGCSAYPASRDYPFKWRAVIAGPKNTPFEGGTFSIDVTFPQDYPNHPPKIKFTTKIYHPNVSEDGDIGLDIIRSKWSPGVTVESVLLAIVDLMKTPDMNCVLHRKAAQHYKEDYQLYDTIAREWTQTFAEPDEEDPGVWPPVI